MPTAKPASFHGGFLNAGSHAPAWEPNDRDPARRGWLGSNEVSPQLQVKDEGGRMKNKKRRWSPTNARSFFLHPSAFILSCRGLAPLDPGHPIVIILKFGTTEIGILR